MKKLVPVLVAIVLTINATAQRTVTFQSNDGVTITADIYLNADSTLPYMLLCHMAGSSRGEYKETAKKFMRLGYNCMAVDLRSGKEMNGVVNQTNLSAVKSKKGTDYLDAEKDIDAALEYLSDKSGKKVVLVGSSYSASLALKIATNNDKVSSVIAFSPGEYFGKNLKLKTVIEELNKPVLVMSTAKERDEVNTLMKDVLSKKKTIFSPSTDGEHGSKAIWNVNPNHGDYLMSMITFFNS